MTDANSGLSGCPCYDASNNEITCAADLDTSSCFETISYFQCVDEEDSEGNTVTGTAGTEYISESSDCSTYDMDADGVAQ